MEPRRGFCQLCGRYTNLEVHHIMAGVANRKLSEKYKDDGLVAYLCHWCHNEPPTGAHFNRETDLLLKRRAQREFESKHGHEQWMRVFGKNYLED